MAAWQQSSTLFMDSDPPSAGSTPVMLERLADIDVIVLDAAVTSGPPGERARRLLENRRRVAPQHLPKLMVTAHNDVEYQRAQEAAQRFGPLVDSVRVQVEPGRNASAVNALALHREYWPSTTEQERKNRILLLGR